ncbi:MAG: nitrogen fixation protein NifH [Acidimicrobiia bacterium]|nr:nitrogen fixation protein NifH [Acidimicrobiia bacterium]
MAWADVLSESPLPWLLEPSDPAVRASSLSRLLDQDEADGEFRTARTKAMKVYPIAGILAAQDKAGWWAKPGPGYGPKYRGTVWNLMFLDQLGADPGDDGIQRACDYVLTWSSTAVGGFGASGTHIERNPPPSSALHCLNGNLTRALIHFGHLDHPTVRAATDWAARTILGEDVERWYVSGTSGPGFACGVNEELPCAWGAVKEMLGLAAIPIDQRTDREQRAIDAGIEFLLSRDPADADYPMGYGNTEPNSSWFKPGFPSGYIADVLQNMEALAELGVAADSRLDNAYEWLVGLADDSGRWKNRYAYTSKTTVPIEKQGAASKWVTLRASTVLRARHGD